MQSGTTRVTIIPAFTRPSTVGPVGLTAKKRVAAYARVSTDSEEQLSSYEAQVDHYTQHIKSKQDWEFIEVYSDEGISATNTKHREGFKRMIQDALDGKIDLILTKSVSRFARNTVDTLTTVRKLKEKNVEVYFEKENIYTLDSKGELLITIMSSLAQEESRSLSENVKWGQRKRFADGKVSLPYKQFLGYEKGEDGLPKIVEKEAAIIRKIYALFLEGKTPNAIAKYLTQRRIPTPAGKAQWHYTTVRSILTNEKYKGDALLQKNFTVDYLTKKMKVNQGEVPQVFVENSHPPIVTSEIFDLVQLEMRNRKDTGRSVSNQGCFSGKVVCGDCGGSFGRKIWHSTSKYRRTVWQCNGKFHHSEKCSTPHLYEDTIKSLFLEAFNGIIENKAAILEDYEDIAKQLTDSTELQRERKALDRQCQTLEAAVNRFVEENARMPLDQEEYHRRYQEYLQEYQALRDRSTELSEEIRLKKAKYVQMMEFLKTLKAKDVLLTEFDEKLWNLTVSTLVVKSPTEVVFTFKDGTERVLTLTEK